MLYEFYQLKKTDAGWQAACAAIFDLKSNKLRPDGWTSADAAGLPIFPAVVRYDELKRGAVEHAMRVTVRKTRRAYVHPATHFASRLTDENLPRMGERIRLRRDFDTSRFTPEVKAILEGLKKHGMLVADNGTRLVGVCGSRRTDTTAARGTAKSEGIGLRSRRAAQEVAAVVRRIAGVEQRQRLQQSRNYEPRCRRRCPLTVNDVLCYP